MFNSANERPEAAQIRRARRQALGSLFSLALASGAALGEFAAPQAAAAAGLLTCQRLEQNCEASIAREMNALTHVRADQAATKDPLKLSAHRCQSQYEAAQKTGIWPGYNGGPSLPCKL